MNKNYTNTLKSAQSNGSLDGITACTRVMIVAFYNAKGECLPDWPDKEKGEIFTTMRTEMLEILAQGKSDTFTVEAEHAIEVAMEKMEVCRL